MSQSLFLQGRFHLQVILIIAMYMVYLSQSLFLQGRFHPGRLPINLEWKLKYEMSQSLFLQGRFHHAFDLSWYDVLVAGVAIPFSIGQVSSFTVGIGAFARNTVAIPFSIGQVSSMEDEFRFIVIKLYESQSLFLQGRFHRD